MNVSGSYWRGTLIVAGTVLVSAVVVLAGARSGARPVRAAQDLGASAEPIGALELTERSGRTVTESDFAERVCIVSFIFTRCQLSCPRISSIMKSLQAQLEDSSVQLVSISVDPEHDTPQVLSDYARRFDADPARWWFLTGPPEPIYTLIQRRFKLSVAENPTAGTGGTSEAIAHSDRLALVDHGRITGLFDSNESAEIAALVERAKRQALPGWIQAMPTVNASLNGLCALFLVVGWSAIRRRNAAGPTATLASESVLSVPGVRGHVTCMVLAVSTSAIFLICYLTYHFFAGFMRFRGEGAVRWVYLTILMSHTVLATLGVVPLVLLTLFRAVRRDFARHRLIAATTFPVWLYVSVTGVVIYVMLYHPINIDPN